MENSRNIVFYDGKCMLCNRFVRFLFKKQIPNLFFSELQSNFAREILTPYSISVEKLDTVYLYKEGKVYSHSSAIIQLLITINVFYKVLGYSLLLIPQFIRDFVYKIIARNRHKSNKYTSCLVLTSDEQLRILK